MIKWVINKAQAKIMNIKKHDHRFMVSNPIKLGKKHFKIGELYYSPSRKIREK